MGSHETQTPSSRATRRSDLDLRTRLLIRSSGFESWGPTNEPAGRGPTSVLVATAATRSSPSLPVSDRASLEPMNSESVGLAFEARLRFQQIHVGHSAWNGHCRSIPVSDTLSSGGKPRILGPETAIMPQPNTRDADPPRSERSFARATAPSQETPAGPTKVTPTVGWSQRFLEAMALTIWSASLPTPRKKPDDIA
jgi:hypothetical protein